MKNILHILFSATIFLFSFSSFAQDYQTVQSGQWTNSSTWENGNVPPKKQNNITIRINEGHAVVFHADAQKHEMGNGVTVEVNGSFTKNGWNTFKVGTNAHFIVNGSMIFNWNEFEAKNNITFDIHGSFENKTNSVLKNNTVFNVSEEGYFKNTSTLETGENAEFNVSEGGFMENSQSLKAQDNSTFNISGELILSGGQGLETGNDMTINIEETGDVTIKQTFKTENNLILNVEGNFANTSGGDFTAGDDSSIQVGQNGVFLTIKTMNFGDALEMMIEGYFANTSGGNFSAGDGSSIQVGENGDFLTSKTMNFGDALEMMIEGNFANTAGGGFTAGNNTYVHVTDNGTFTSATSTSFGNELLMLVDGEALVSGWNFSFGQNSEIQVLGTLDVDNDYVFNSNSSDNVFYACEGSVNNPGYINNVVYLDCQVLPVELLYFEAQIDNNNDVLLTWATASETNSDFFTVERSTDGQNWSALQTIQSAGNSNHLIEYAYTDTETQSGIYYYRLVQNDFDGAFEIFQPVAIEKQKLNTFAIYNVYRSQNQVTIQGGFQSQDRVIVTDMMGNVLYNGSLTTDQPQISFHVDNNVSAIVVNYMDGVKRESVYSRKFAL